MGSLGRIRHKVSENVRRWREVRGLTQEKLAEMMGAERALIARVENTPQNMGIELLERIASALGVTVSELVEDSSGKKSEGCRLALEERIGELEARVAELATNLETAEEALRASRPQLDALQKLLGILKKRK